MTGKNLLIEKLKDILEKATTRLQSRPSAKEIKVEHPTDPSHGDYASNIAMQIAKELGKPPMEIAKEIISNIEKNDLIEKVEIAGPGFINFFISEKAFENEVKKALTEKEKFGSTEIGKGKNIVLDYSSPNIAKPLGAHHLLSTVIGQSLYNIHKFLGYKCVGVNHIGDWGTQFGKLIYAYRKWADREAIRKDFANELLKLYVKFHDEAEKNPEIEDEARLEFKKLEDGDEENKKLWKWFVDEGLKDLQKSYDDLGGIHFDHIHGESFYEDKMEGILQDGKKKGVFVEGEEGAYVVKYDDPNIAPFVVQKKDGATLYSTRDFATLKYRIDTWHPEKVLYVVDIAQTLHFRQLFAGAERFPWYNNEGVHVWFGRMQMKDKNMSTRKGNVILLDEVLEKAKDRAGKIIEEKSPDLKDKDGTSKIIGNGAVKYNILSQNRTSDIVFDWDRMLSLEGNSAPYLQYSYARARSILRKASTIKKSGTDNEPENKQKIAQATRSLIRLFPKFAEQIISSAEEYKPNIIGNYLYELAQKFNSFYNNVPVLRAEKESDRKSRLEIVEATSQILKNGLQLLSVEVVEEM